MPFHSSQAYGDAVFDEAPLLVITNYRVTVFLKRSPDVKDKRLWASEPIWLDDTSPPPRVSWLHGLQLAHELQGWKASLPRADVPASRKRKLIAEESANGVSSDSRRVMPRKTNVSSSRQVSNPSYEGHEMELPPSAAPQPTNDLTNLRSEETVLLSELEFGSLINKGSYANTFKVSPCVSQRLTPIAEAFTLHTLTVHEHTLSWIRTRRAGPGIKQEPIRLDLAHGLQCCIDDVMLLHGTKL